MTSRPPELHKMLTEIITTPTISCVDPSLDMGNRTLAEKIANWLETIGFSVELLPVSPDGGKVNLVATLGAGAGGLVLAGHLDTVPYDEGRWTHDPFTLTEVDGRIYGLGTADMKSFFAMAVHAAGAYRAEVLDQPLIILGTADEETSMSGARALAAAGKPRARYAVIGEPTGLRPVRMHKGILMEEILVIGHSGHSSDPSLGVNALEHMHRVISLLLDWRTELQQRYRMPAFDIAVPTLNLGHIHGGDNPNRICGECALHLDMRLLPGMPVEEMRAEMRDRVQRVLKDTPAEVRFRSLFEGIESMETPAASPIVRAAERLTGHRAQTVAFSTEAPFLRALGMDVLVLGAGDIEQAHQPDEFLAEARMHDYLDVLTRLIDKFCLSSQSSAQV